MSASSLRAGESTDVSAVATSPPLAAQPARPTRGDEARARLHRVAIELIRSRNRRLLTEFLTLRRTVA